LHNVLTQVVLFTDYQLVNTSHRKTLPFLAQLTCVTDRLMDRRMEIPNPEVTAENMIRILGYK